MTPVPRRVTEGVKSVMSCGQPATVTITNWALREEHFCQEHAQKALQELAAAVYPNRSVEERTNVGC